MWDLSSQTRNWTPIPCIGRWILNHWTAREVLVMCCFKSPPIQIFRLWCNFSGAWEDIIRWYLPPMSCPLLVPRGTVYLPHRRLNGKFASIYSLKKKTLLNTYPIWDILYKWNACKLNCQQPHGFLHLCSTETSRITCPKWNSSTNCKCTSLFLTLAKVISNHLIIQVRNSGLLLEQWYSKCGLQMS